MPTTLIPLLPFLSVFVFSFLLLILTTICIFLHYLLKHTGIKYKYLWKIDGIILGIGSVFFTCLILKLISSPTNISEIWLLLGSLFLPMIGELEYYKYLIKITKRIRVIGKLNLVARFFSKKDWIRANTLVETHKVISNYNKEIEKKFSDIKDEEFNDEFTNEYFDISKHFLSELGNRKIVEDKATEATIAFLAMTFWWGVLGYFLGIVLVHFILFN